MKLLKSTLPLVALTTLLLSCGQEKKSTEINSAELADNTQMASAESHDANANWSDADPTIAGVAASNEQFSTLVTALGEAGLVRTLDGEGPFTVFAPTNEAFEKLPAGTVESLLKQENAALLTKVLTYHVIPGEFKAEAVIQAIQENDNAFPVETVEGSVITLSLKDGNVMLTDVAGNTSLVTQADVSASNGVIHVIDTVVMPQ